MRLQPLVKNTLLGKVLRRGPVRAASGAYTHGWRLRNRRKPRVLLYTDSRGFDVLNPLNNFPYRTYTASLMRTYRVTPVICPERYTTIIDFLDYMAQTKDTFDVVVMHCGIVDFSPRPLANLSHLIADKQHRQSFKELFVANQAHYENPTSVLYRGEPTINIYSREYLEHSVVPRLLAISNLIWISSNHFVPGWEGNYDKGRPANIEQMVFGFDDLMRASLPNVVALGQWTATDVKRYTIDNIHFTREGFERVHELLDAEISRVAKEPARPAYAKPVSSLR